jgi:hypothetical protein
VPAAKRLRANRKAGAAFGWEQTAGRCPQYAIDGRVLRPLSAAPEDRQLVTQDDDLKLSLTTAADERANKPAQDPIQQTRQDKPSLNRSGRDHQQQPFRRIEFLYPTGRIKRR